MSWLKKLLPSTIRTSATDKKGVPEGVWMRCPSCTAMLYRKELERVLQVCPKCQYHIGLTGRQRLESFLDEGSLHELAADIGAIDRLKFKDSKKYKDRLTQAQKSTGETESLIVAKGSLYQMPVVAAAFVFKFIGGSMGCALGERFVRGVNVAIETNSPFICFSASGGARMQEGLFSLLQMSKTSAALARLSEAGLPFISVLTDPTMGGVSASLAMLGDVIIAEPRALIGFAGPRVIEQTVREQLPEGFQRSEFLLSHGAIDMIIPRKLLRPRITRLLAKMMRQEVDIPDEELLLLQNLDDA